MWVEVGIRKISKPEFTFIRGMRVPIWGPMSNNTITI